MVESFPAQVERVDQSVLDAENFQQQQPRGRLRGAEATALRSAASAWAARPRARHARPSTRRVELVAPPLALILRQSSSAVVQSPAWAAASARLRIAVSSLPPISLNPSSTTAIPPSAAKRIRNQSPRQSPDRCCWTLGRGVHSLREDDRGEERRGMRRPDP